MCDYKAFREAYAGAGELFTEKLWAVESSANQYGSVSFAAKRCKHLVHVSVPIFSKEAEKAKAAYDSCCEEFAGALEEARASGIGTPQQLERVITLSRRCDELMHSYLEALKKHYGKNT